MDGLLAVARAENVVPVPTTVDVTEVARERFVAWHPVADDRGITLETLAPGGRVPDQVLAWMGEGHLEQILDNLVANALEALEAGGHVTVTTSATAAGAQIVVADDGPGMSAEDRERAFLRFTTSNPNGTGLGLAIVHRLVTSNGGTARLTETPGGGLTAILDFPGVPSANGASTLPMNAVPQEHSPVRFHPGSRQPVTPRPCRKAPRPRRPAPGICPPGQECHHVRVPIRQRAGQIAACPLPSEDHPA